MNIITRYTLPVIVAAGLHGALFLSGSHTPFVRDPGKTVNKDPLRPIPTEVDFREPEEPTALASAGGAVDPLPSPPEIPPPMDLKDLFTIAATERTTPIKDVLKLPSPEKMSFNPGSEGGSGPGGPIGVPSVVNLDRVPRTIAQPSPDYPYALKHDGVDGSVTVEFTVGTDGRVITAEAVKWTRREFVDSAVKAVLRWRFEPGTMNGRKVRFRMAVPIEFNAAG